MMPMSNLPVLTNDMKHEILEKVLAALQTKFYKPELLNARWDEAVAAQRQAIECAPTHEAFEEAVSGLLKELKTSHFGFFHGSAHRASSRAALSATYLEEDTDHGRRWVFQDVHSGGAAATAGIAPGDILLSVSGKQIIPPDHPVFPMGKILDVEVDTGSGTVKMVRVDVARPKGKKLHFIEPTLVESRRLTSDLGYLKVAMFPGMVGMDVANQISAAADDLEGTKGLILDLRGNTGGGVGALRVMSLLTPDKVPVGFSLNRNWKGNLEEEKKGFSRFNSIPEKKSGLWLLALRFFPAMVQKSPIVLETEGLGKRSFQGNIVLLVDRHTASAAEMIVAFAQDNQLATVAGENTAGRLLAADSVKVGHGYRLALPTGSYHTWSGRVLEGTPIKPEVNLPFDWRGRRTGKDEQLERAQSLTAIG